MNAHIHFSTRNGRRHGKIVIRTTDEPTTAGLVGSSPVVNNTIHYHGVFASELEAAEAAANYFDIEGVVWGVESTFENDVEVHFSKPKIDRKSNPHLIVRNLTL